MRFDVVTIFPKMFGAYLNESIIKRAQRKKLVSFHFHDLRDFTTDKHRSVDDRPYGGGPGMVMKVEPIYKALKAVPRKGKRRVLLMSAKGKMFMQADARRLLKYKQIVIICPRYEGVDERVLDYVDEEISIGPYVLTGGELPAMVVMDAVTRLIPGVLGKDESSLDESHSQAGVLEYPQFTRPEVWRRKHVPRVLLSGDHNKIAAWRQRLRKRIQ
ncbi:MAG: tRNA (guanosine(37)-N1)-methyltransferase TrmD [Candidatus Kerfeldbacteria bacterium]|nr:tRNA (guanosine(37)-N1)-methyltransferase TrmD [Candidatus Kerfeldbacteria bacterium]